MCCLFIYDNYKLFLEIGGLIVSIFTLILAWKIYRNLDVKKSFVNEQLKVVCDLSNDMRNFGMYCNYISGGVARNYPRFFDFFYGDLNREELKKYRTIYFSTMRPIEVLPFIKYSHNILLPKSIATIVEQFDINILNPTWVNDLPNSYTLIHSENSEIKESNNCYYYMDYDKFYELTGKLVSEIIKWLNSYGAKDINIPANMIYKYELYDLTEEEIKIVEAT